MSEIKDELKRYGWQIAGYGCIFFSSIFAWTREAGVAAAFLIGAGLIDAWVAVVNWLVRHGHITGDDIDTITNWTRRQFKYHWDLVWLGGWCGITTVVIIGNWGELFWYEYVLFLLLFAIQLHLRLQKQKGE